MIIPEKIKSGDKIKVIAPSTSMKIISEETQAIAEAHFKEMGLIVTYGTNVLEMDEFGSSSIESRIQDIHEAFQDNSIKAIFPIIGGFNCNQLLRYLDYEIIKENPKIFCGYSDTTALQNAIFAKTGLVTYSSPAFSTFGMKRGCDYTIENFKKACFQSNTFEISPSKNWSDDQWYIDQEQRTFISNDGWKIWNSGEAEGTIIGGNLCTLNLLQGTEYMPSLRGSVLFLEDDDFVGSDSHVEFDRKLQSLIHLPDFDHVKAIVLGRFPKNCEISKEKLEKIIKSKKELANIPIISDLDFGHTTPHFTFPIGGKVQIKASENNSQIKIIGNE